MITSTNNAQVKNVILLQKKQKVRKEQGAFVIEGKKLFIEAKELGILKMTYISENFYDNMAENNLLHDINYEIVEDKIFMHMSDTVTPQGIISIVHMPNYQIMDIYKINKGTLLLLEDLRDPGNLGTIFRTAEAAGIEGIILSKECVDIYNPKVIRSTMGSIFRLPYFYVENFTDILKSLKENKFTLFATHLSGKVFYDEVDYSGKSGIIIGNEAHGISKNVEMEADVLIKIPMCGQVESLNAGIAASVIMYETFRQRKNNYQPVF